MGCAEGRSPFAGSLRACPELVEGVSLSYKLFPLPGQACPESIEGKGVRGMVVPMAIGTTILLGQVVTYGVRRALAAVLGNVLVGGGGRQRSLGGGGYRLLEFA